MDEDQQRLLQSAGLDNSASLTPTLTASTAGVCAGDAKFETLYSTYRPLLRKIALRKYHVPPADVDVLVHDVFTTYLARQDRVREVHPYLIGGICNASRDYWRRMDKERALFCDAEPSAAADDALLNSVAETLMVRSALGTLGASCRETLHRFYIDGETATCIAASRNTTQGSILRLLQYCRNRARAAYRALREGR